MRIIHRLVTADLHGDFHIGPTEGGSIAVLRFPIVHEPVIQPPPTLPWQSRNSNPGCYPPKVTRTQDEHHLLWHATPHSAPFSRRNGEGMGMRA